MSRPTRNQVFISYSHADREWLLMLQKMLKPLERDSTITTWNDTVIQPGQLWKDEIERALTLAKVAVLLVSDTFLASDFVAKHELPPLLDAARREGVKILWVCLSHCLFDETEIGDYQAANDPNHPLDTLSPPEQKQVLAKICRQIKEAALAEEEAERLKREGEERAEREEAERRARARDAEEEFVRLQEEIQSALTREEWDTVVRASESLLRITPSDKKAKAILTQACHQKDLLTIYSKGKQHYESGDLYLALVEFRTLRVKENNYKDVETLIPHIEGTIKEKEVLLKAAAQVATAGHDWEKAIQSLEALLKLTPSNEEVRRWLTEARQNQENLLRAYSDGVDNLQKGSLETALRHLLQARRIGGNYKDVAALIADVQRKLQSREEERRRREQAAEEKAGRLKAEAKAATDKKDWWKVTEHLTALRRLDPNSTYAIEGLKFAEQQIQLWNLYNRGMKKYKDGKLDEALFSFRQIHEQQADYKDVAILIVKTERKKAKNKILFPLKYYGSSIGGVVGILISLYLFTGWVSGNTAKVYWSSLGLVTIVSWASFIYFLILRVGRGQAANESFGCVALIVVFAVPFLALLGYALAPGYRLGLATAYVESASRPDVNNADQLIDELTRAININPENARAYHYRGRAYELKGDYEHAINDISRAIKLDPTQEAFFINRGWTHYRVRNYGRAFSDFTEAIRLKPDSADYYYQRGVAFYHVKDYERAILDFDRAAKARADFIKALEYLGQAYHAIGDNDSALSSLNSAIKINPIYEKAYLYRGIVYADKKEFDRAIADFDRAIELRKDFAEAYLERGKAYINRSEEPDYNQAAIDLGNAVNKTPNNAEALYYLGWVHHQLKEYGQAISRLDEAIKLNKDYGDAYEARGSAYAAIEKYDLAISDFSRSIELSKGTKVNSYFERGVASEKIGDRVSAMADFQKVLEFRTSNLISEAKRHLRRLSAQP